MNSEQLLYLKLKHGHRVQNHIDNILLNDHVLKILYGTYVGKEVSVEDSHTHRDKILEETIIAMCETILNSVDISDLDDELESTIASVFKNYMRASRPSRGDVKRC